MSKEIKYQIDALNKELEEVIAPGTFTLNLKAVALLDKIAELQGQCKHNFVNGMCEFCYMEEK